MMMMMMMDDESVTTTTTTTTSTSAVATAIMAELQNPQLVMPRVINFLSDLLQRVADGNDYNNNVCRCSDQNISLFHGLARPTISIRSYLERIFKYANCSPSCFIVAYIYLDRFTHKQPTIPICSFSIHRLLITSVLVSAKFMDDIFYSNAVYAKVGGISTMEMNLLEIDFLFGMEFELNVTPATFYTYFTNIRRQMLLLEFPPLYMEPSSSSSTVNLRLLHRYITEDESTTVHCQLAV